jgi:ribosomal protein S8E
MIHYRFITSVIDKTGGKRRKRKTKRKCKFDEDESPYGVIPPVKVVGKEGIGLFFFPQHPRTTLALLHQLKHPSCITRLLVVGPPGFTKGG